MNNVKTYVGPLKHEKIQFFYRKHWAYFLKPIFFGGSIALIVTLFFFLLAFLLNLFQFTMVYPFFGYLIIIISILFLNIFFIPVINYFFNLVIITNHRIIISKKTLYLKNDNEGIDLTKIQDIGVVSRGIIRNYLNYGSLIITLSTSSPPLCIPYTPNPHYYLEMLNKTKRDYILNRQEKVNNLYNKNKSFEYLQDIDKLEYI